MFYCFYYDKEKLLNMKKKYILGIFLTVFSVSTFAQQDAQFLLFPWATPYYNAGAIGEQSNTLCFTGIFRQQYAGWKDTYVPTNSTDGTQLINTSPQQIYLSLESYLRKLHGGIGVTFIKDKIGFFNNVGVKLGYSFKLRIPTGTLGIGLQVQMLSQKLDNSYFMPIQQGDALLNSFTKDESWLDLDFSFGLFYKADRWNAGIGMTQIAEKIRLSGDKNSYQMSRNMYIHGGYTWVLPWDPSWEIIPQALIKTDLATAQFDLMVLARYNGILWGGLSYRIQDAVSVLFGARPFYNSSNNYLKGLEMGLGYSFTTSKLGYQKHRSYGDFEIVLRYCFDIYKEEVFSGYGSTRSIYKNQY